MVHEIHPDANLIAALLEGGLPAADRTVLLQHMADCAPCRRWLVCAQAAPATQAGFGRSASGVTPSFWRLGWEAPLATAASLAVVAAGIWLVLPARVAAPAAPLRQIATLTAAPVSIPVTLPSTKIKLLATGSAPVVVPPQLQTQNLRPMASPLPTNGRTAIAALHFPNSTVAAAAPPIVEIQPSIDFSPLMTGFLDQAPPRLGVRSQLAAFEPDTADRPAVNPASGFAGGVGALGLSFQGGGTPSGPLAPALATTLGWAISHSGQVLKSVGTDLWAAVPLVPGLHVHALSSTDTAIWAGGLASQLYVSRDSGGHWLRVSLPGVDAANSQTPISSIIFSDGLNGTVTTGDGHSWLTRDGGKTWIANGN
ncbi:MAG: zf-HC2 domain-containing protein [Terriglobales bacterium]